MSWYPSHLIIYILLSEDFLHLEAMVNFDFIFALLIISMIYISVSDSLFT